MPHYRGADIVAQTLARAGVTQIFSLSGNHIMPLYDAAIDARLAITHTRHEGAAVHMADAWGRLTGEPGLLPGLVHRGGLRARILNEGTIQVGDTIRPANATTPGA